MNLKKILHTEQDKESLIKFLQDFEISSPHRVEIKKIRPIRTMPQNRFMWLCFAIAEMETGTDKDYYYNHYIKKFAPTIEVMMFGELEYQKKTSSKYDTKEMTDFIDKCRQDLLFEGIPTPEPNDKNLAEIFEFYRSKGYL